MTLYQLSSINVSSASRFVATEPSTSSAVKLWHLLQISGLAVEGVVGAALIVGQVRWRQGFLHVAGGTGVLQRRVSTRKSGGISRAFGWLAQVHKISVLSHQHVSLRDPCGARSGSVGGTSSLRNPRREL